MNKTTEALRLAEEALEELHYSSGTVKAVTLYKSAIAAIREALADHIANAGKMIAEPVDAVEVTDLSEPEGCDYCKHPIFAGTKCNNCGRVTIAEPANTRSTSEYLEPVKQEPVAVISESAIGLVKLHSNGACLPFGTQLYAAPVSVEAAVLAEREACAKVCDEYHVASEYPGYIDCAAAIRARDMK